jgi:hypothetical protein
MFVVNKIEKYFVNRTDQENEVYPEFSYSELINHTAFTDFIFYQS